MVGASMAILDNLRGILAKIYGSTATKSEVPLNVMLSSKTEGQKNKLRGFDAFNIYSGETFSPDAMDWEQVPEALIQDVQVSCENALKQIEIMFGVHWYRDEHAEELVYAQLNVKKILNYASEYFELARATSTPLVHPIDNLTYHRLLQQLNTDMTPVKRAVFHVREAFLHQLNVLDSKCRALVSLNDKGAHPADKRFESVFLELIELRKDVLESPLVIARVYFDKLTQVTEAIVVFEKDVALNVSLLEKQKRRQRLPEVTVLKDMLDKLALERGSLTKTDQREALLKTLTNEFEGSLEDYCGHPRRSKNTFLLQLVEFLKKELSSERVNQLPDEVAASFVDFIHVLIKPLSGLLHPENIEAYNPLFFANTSKKKIMRSDEKILKALDELDLLLERPSGQGRLAPQEITTTRTP